MSDSEIKTAFLAFANFGAGSGSKKEELESKNLTKLVKDCGLFNKGKLNGAEVDMIFTRCKSKRNIPFENFRDKAIPQLASAVHGNSESASIQKIVDAIVNGAPKSNSKATISATGGVDRMTDTKNYTGSHAHRFDESGKGKGAAGREDKVSSDGYVQGYSNKGTYKN
ncbi:tubulin polymerization-promoting protein family member 2-like [Convolutriloba macropyga]|uniref:tubulin polymerization-promoting protein family member 2-like n=1 Tax=Convolutriloba macropyga TaxID=536237 RepID=UPI003F525D07